MAQVTHLAVALGLKNLVHGQGGEMIPGGSLANSALLFSGKVNVLKSLLASVRLLKVFLSLTKEIMFSMIVVGSWGIFGFRSIY